MIVRNNNKPPMAAEGNEMMDITMFQQLKQYQGLLQKIESIDATIAELTHKREIADSQIGILINEIKLNTNDKRIIAIVLDYFYGDIVKYENTIKLRELSTEDYREYKNAQP